MKHLTLIRHAKSSWDAGVLTDRERPLNDRGRRDAPVMGRRLGERSPAPDLIVASPALRAQETANAIAAALEYATDRIATESAIYEAMVADLLEVVRNLDPQHDRVALVGHNPGITDFITEVTRDRIDNVPTCGVVELCFDASWAEFPGEIAELIHFDYPKKLPPSGN